MTGPDVLWTATDALQAIGGHNTADWSAASVSIDSRSLAPGALFFALGGPRFDGHDFVVSAFEKGAVAAVVHRVPDHLPSGAPLLIVDDTLVALDMLGRAARSRASAKVIGVTGSVGKTGTKIMMRQSFSALGDTHSSDSSFNNQIGVPLSVARMPPGAAFGVFEMGMNHAGEIAHLTEIVRPDVAVITTIEATHLEFLGSLEAIANAKAEIFDGMTNAGVAVLNRDNPFYRQLATAARAGGVDRIISFGTVRDSDVRLTDYRPAACGHHVTATVAGRKVTYCLQPAGRHWAVNSLAVLAAVRAVDGDVDRAAAGLADVIAPVGRGARHMVSIGSGTVELIDDSYNASPASVRAAIAVLGEAGRSAAASAPTGRRIAVLGDMLELGPTELEFHANLAPDLLAADVDLVFTAGPRMAALHAALPADMRATHGVDSSALIEPLLRTLAPGDVVLVKGSLGSRMAPVVSAIQDADMAASKRETDGQDS